MRGAEKISVNSPALADPALIDRLADALRFAVRGGRHRQPDDAATASASTSSPATRTAAATPGATRWPGCARCRTRGAGEIVLNCMASDGVRRGYDIAQLLAVRAVCDVPLVASGGAGAPEHFAALFERHAADAALAASVFHSGQIAIPDLKQYLKSRHIEVRT